MPSAPADLWFQQARSDLKTAAELLKTNDAELYCQVIAKYQQTVEKAIKGLVAALNSSRLITRTPTQNHDVKAEIQALTTLISDPKNMRRAEADTVKLIIQFIEWIGFARPPNLWSKRQMKSRHLCPVLHNLI